jgi:hypothetical protein
MEGVPPIVLRPHAVKIGSWDTKIVHSQGTLSASVHELLESECGKVHGPKRYQNLLPLEEVIEYLNWRDQMDF